MDRLGNPGCIPNPQKEDDINNLGKELVVPRYALGIISSTPLKYSNLNYH
jgi:hypothetical protein